MSTIASTRLPSGAALLARPDVRSATPVAPDDAHLTQFPTARVPDARAWGNSDCGPTSVLMSTRLLGLEHPAARGLSGQAAIDAVRASMTGRIDPDDATDKSEQAAALTAAGASVVRTRSLDTALAAVRDGAVFLAGGDRHAVGWPASPNDAVRAASLWTPDEAGPVAIQSGAALPIGQPRSGHAVVVSNWIPELDRYVLDDPSLADPALVSREQLIAFTQVGSKAAGHMRREGIVAWAPSKEPSATLGGAAPVAG